MADTGSAGEGRASAPAKNIRAYDRERMQRIALAMWGAVLVELKDDQGVCFIPMGELMDAAAMMLAVPLSTSPQSKVPSQLRELCADFAKNLARRTADAKADPGTAKLFDVVMSDLEAVH
jgi:hypothetical protein